jgi:cytochrome b pre-mRNA-processing protein 3
VFKFKRKFWRRRVNGLIHLIAVYASKNNFYLLFVVFCLELQMPDTFYSWFLVTELHVWMLMVRTMAEGEEGRFVRNNIVEAMWEDVITRVKKLEVCAEDIVHYKIYIQWALELRPA